MKFILILFLSCSVYAVSAAQIISPYNMDDFNQVITKLYTSPDSQSDDIVTRIIADSATFLDAPYTLGALGEELNGKFDKSPLYRTDTFDCQTFVSTVLALVEATDLKQFQKNIIKVRYRNNIVSYFTRNHFASVDWNMANLRNGYLKDVTDQIVDQQDRPVAAVAYTIIDKPSWYSFKTATTLKTFTKLSRINEKKLVDELHKYATQTQKERSTILYIPLNRLFDRRGRPNAYLFKQIPAVAVIEMIRPDWNLKQQIGTNLNVSHMGLAIRTQDGLIFREASSNSRIGDGVLDVSLIDYLHNCIGVKGINVQQIVLPAPKTE